ncbi:MAG: hypothetical protein ACFFCQ_07060, partial [Promethearchaeota archaeon]
GAVFRDLTPEYVRPYVQSEADDRGIDPNELVNEVIQLYSAKLEETYGDEYAERLNQYADRISVLAITPKNPVGTQVDMTPDFERPIEYKTLMDETPDIVQNALDIKIQLLLARCGETNLTSTDNRVVFFSELIHHAWREMKIKNLNLDQIIKFLLKPPITQVGVIDVEEFFPTSKRKSLANKINSLMIKAVPGVKLDIDKLFEIARSGSRTGEKKSPLIVFDLRKITEETEKQTFVAEILQAVQRWIWSKGGTNRLRAILYFDELAGFVPPIRQPPSKTALMLILKQARSFGLGCLLATQNPGDLDYKALGNIATWYLGRLTSEQDISKVSRALQSVFEAQGGTVEEFREVQKSIRGQKSCHFVFYNAKYGVRYIQVRWLMTYHRGPLTDTEIQLISVKPPISTRRRKQIDEEVEEIEDEEKKDEKITSGVQFPLTRKRPKISKFGERFLAPRIPLKNKHLEQLITDRYSLHQDKMKGLEISIDKIRPYWTPVLASTVNIQIKRQFIAEEVKIPVSIEHTHNRAYDLTRDIDWDANTVEGIHPSTLAPQVTRLDPIPQIPEFTDIKETKINKVADNISWYFLNMPYQGIEDAVYQSLTEFETKELRKIKQKYGKKLDRFENSFMKKNDILNRDESKLGELQKKLNDLNSELQEKKAEGKATTRIENSLESTKERINKIEMKNKETSKEIEVIEVDRDQLRQEFNDATQLIQDKVGNLRSQAVPDDFYRAKKKEVQIEEQIIHWIPRIILNFTLTQSNNDLKLETQADFNLVNGNGYIPCSTDDPDETCIACDHSCEICPPIFLCSVCSKPFCVNHSSECPKCGKIVCTEHRALCVVCEEGYCENCLLQCATCGKPVCNEHTVKCDFCGKINCEDEALTRCNECEKQACPACAEQIRTCSICGEELCVTDHISECEACGKPMCEKHLQTCKNCKSQICGDDIKASIKISGQKQAIRCAKC